AWALVDRSIWALVAGGFATYSMRTLLSHVWLPGTANRWCWDKSALGEIIHVGRWIVASSIMSFLVANGDRLLLGGILDAH
ncbi:oligosaccharide flippase family protein, partial [Acinetobacter baumannii]